MNTTDILITLILSIMTNITLLGVMFYLTAVSITKIRTSKKALGLIALSLVIMYLIYPFFPPVTISVSGSHYGYCVIDKPRL